MKPETPLHPSTPDWITPVARVLLALFRRAAELAREEAEPQAHPSIPLPSAPPVPAQVAHQDALAPLPGLFAQAVSFPNLWQAWHRVRENDGAPGPDGRTTADFARHIEEELALLHAQLRSGTYRPSGGLCREIPKPGTDKKRRLILATVRDRVVQTAVSQILTPYLDPGFSALSYAYRPGRGAHEAVRALKSILKAGTHPWAVDLDFQEFFDSIPHRPLLARLQDTLDDRPLVTLTSLLLRGKVRLPKRGWVRSKRGVSQGSALSPVLANFYLTPLDRILERLPETHALRYADDLIVLCREETEARAALDRIQRFAQGNGLRVHPEKTRIADLRQETVTFLGYSFAAHRLAPSSKAETRLRERIAGPLASSTSSPAAAYDAEAVERGWMEYFRHADPAELDRVRATLRPGAQSLSFTGTGAPAQSPGDAPS